MTPASSQRLRARVGALPEAAPRQRQAPLRSTALHRFAIFLACAVVLLIAAGGLVKSKEAGLSVPDWPTSYGGFNPPRWWTIDTVRAEHGHRLIAGTVGLLTLGLALWVQRREPRRWARRLAWTAFVAVVVQALLGGITVRLFLPPAVSISHAALAQAFLCLVVAVAVVTSGRWRAEDGVAPVGDVRLRRLATAAVALLFLQILVGAVMRHLGAGLAIPTFPDVFGGLVPPHWSFDIGVHYAHRLGGLLAAVLLTLTAVRVQRAHRGQPALVVPAFGALALAAAQVTLGSLVVLSEKAVAPNTAHVATGAALLACTLVLALESWRGERAREELSS